MTPPRDEPERTALPLRATGIVLGIWMAILLAIAVVLVPAAFGACYPASAP